MKKSFFTLSLIAILSSCANQDDSTPTVTAPTANITNYVYKTYNTTNTPNTVINTTTYKIANNKISDYTGENLQTGQMSSGTYNYVNNKIDEILKYREGLLVEKLNFSYVNGRLSEYLQESINTSTQESFFNKHTFTHAIDTTYVEWRRSSDFGVTFDIPVSDIKMVLDSNANRTYFEDYDYINDDTDSKKNSYDGNNNMINEESFDIYNNGTIINSLTNTMTYEASENPLYLIYNATYGRDNLMLLYHLESNAINNINPKAISPNSLESFSSTFGNTFTYEISNTELGGYVTSNNFETYNSGTQFSRFQIEYLRDF